jgi:hypothetical protein
MKLATFLSWFSVLPLALILLPIRCREPVPELLAAQFPPTIVITEGKTSQGFPYLFGGVSSDEREAMEGRAQGYNVKLVFAEKRGAFISGVTVMIVTAKGAEIASLTTEGPWFYIQLPREITPSRRPSKAKPNRSKNSG